MARMARGSGSALRAVVLLACVVAGLLWLANRFPVPRPASAPAYTPMPNPAAPRPQVTSESAPPPPDFGGGYGRATRTVATDEARAHFAIGSELLNLGDYYTAASHLAMARDGLGDLPAVCRMLAITYDRLNMTSDLLEIMPCLDEAARESEAAARLYDRLARQLDVEIEFQAAASDHFVASFPASGATSAEIGPVLDLLEGAREQVEGELGLGSMRLVPIVVYGRGQFEAATDKPHWASGLYDGKIRMSLETYRDQPDFFEVALTHEYVHALTHEYTGTRLPSWFREGLADGLARSGADNTPRYRPHPEVGRILEIDELNSSFMALPEHLARAAYAQSHAMTIGLVRESGWGALQDLILDLHDDRGLSFDDAFYGLFGETPADYLDRWYTTVH
jgi:hypothetical protein